MTTCVRQAEQAEKRSSDALDQLKKVTSVRLLLYVHLPDYVNDEELSQVEFLI